MDTLIAAFRRKMRDPFKYPTRVIHILMAALIGVVKY